MPRTVSQRPFNLILLGDPGAGKATQGAYLLRRYPFLRQFDFGQWLRDLSLAERKRYRFDTTAAKGILTPTQLAKKKFSEIILTTPPGQGVFFNGNPRMVGEARVIASAFRKAKRDNVIVLYIFVPQQEMLTRLKKRQAHEARSDDKEEYLRNRMKYYRRHVQPTVEFLQSKYPFRRINGLGSREQVFARVAAALERMR